MAKSNRKRERFHQKDHNCLSPRGMNEQKTNYEEKGHKSTHIVTGTKLGWLK